MSEIDDRIAELERRVRELEGAQDTQPQLGLPATGHRRQETEAAKHVATQFVAELNRRTGRLYQVRPPVVDAVRARMREGYTRDDMLVVVWHLCDEWSGDEAMAKYLRPSTILARSKFGERLDVARREYIQRRRRAGLDG